MTININNVVVGGRVLGEPKFYPTTNEGQNDRLSLLLLVKNTWTRSDGQKSVSKVRVKMHGVHARAGADHISKGKEIVIIGSLTTYTDKDGNLQQEVTAREVIYGQDSKFINIDALPPDETQEGA